MHVEIEEPWSAFSDFQKKTGKHYFAKGSFIVFLFIKKFTSHGYLKEILWVVIFLNVCYLNSHIFKSVYKIPSL